MSVLLPNATLGLRRRSTSGAVNSHGEDVPAGWGPVVGVFDGRTNEQSDATWSLALDPALWPVRKDDMVLRTSNGETWLVLSADLIQNNYDSTVDWVRVTAARRSVGGTEPGGAWFVARYTDTVEVTNGLPIEPYSNGNGLWFGDGPPPAGLTAEPGDEYIDLITGAVYAIED